MIKRKYLAACLVAALFVAGCGSNSAEKKETTETTEETKTAEATDAPDQESASEEDAQDETAADDSGEADDSTDEDEQDLTDTEEDEDTGLEEEDLSKVVPADYLVQDADKYVTLGETKDLEAVQYTYEITDDMVQDEIDSELSEASEEISTDKPSVEGDTVYFTMTYKVEGDDSQDGEEEDSSVILGQEDYGAEFDEKLTGVSAGDKLDFSVSYDEDMWMEEWAGKTVDFSVEVSDVVQVEVPEYNLDYVKENTEYTTLEEYEQSIREYLEEEYTNRSYYDVTESLLEAAMANATFDGYPQELYDQCKEEILSSYSMFVGEDNTIDDVLEMFGITDEDVQSETEKLVNRYLFISAYCKANDITADGEEYKDYVTKNADYYGEDAASFEVGYTREYLVENLYDEKVKELLYDSAKITEKPSTEAPAEEAEATDEEIGEGDDLMLDEIQDEEELAQDESVSE